MAELEPRRRRRHLVAAVAAAFLLLAGAGLGAAGGAQAAEGGYFSTSYHRFSTTTAALKSDEIEVGSDRAHAADPNPDLGEVARGPDRRTARRSVGAGVRRHRAQSAG